jgi:hypothetical protein
MPHPTEALTIGLVAAFSEAEPSNSWMLKIGWGRNDTDPEQFIIGGDGFESQFVDSEGETFGLVDLTAPELAPGQVGSVSLWIWH